jgi:YVTN family beta-propeller protein
MFGEIQPAIAGAVVPADDKKVGSPLNRRMVFTEDYMTLYVLFNSEVAVVDLKTNQVKANIKFGLGNPYGIHTTPNGRFVVVPTDSIWYFIDPKQPKPVLQLKLSDVNDAPGIGYYSPNGQTLVIPYNNQLFIIDAVNAKLIGRTNAKTNLPLIAWPQ